MSRKSVIFSKLQKITKITFWRFRNVFVVLSCWVRAANDTKNQMPHRWDSDPRSGAVLFYAVKRLPS
jgi:hypothetical protein